ncbi:glycosyltransferase family 2 protein [Vibrio furnissii]|uniref:glycosyltransferase family 2 protein n=1 Tax=Vibrio furnissii TaxID=29494 RepID=UPI0024BAE806|nr:glycosyltransferase family 2 protein [Vibrio furnissii]WHR51329.1 glycosyltransferase family 2 protein [Vibrio furnissii]
MISICLASYNGEKYIYEQLISILEQIGPEDEIVISDDGSTDRTIDIINSLSDRRIRIVKNVKERVDLSYYPGVYFANRNFSNALKECNGEVIFLSDQDDVWLKGKLRKMCEALETSDLVVSNCSMIDKSGLIIQDSYFDIIPPSSNILRTIFRSSFHGCCMAFNRKVLDRSTPIPNSFIGHDIWLGMIASKFYSVSFIDEPLLLYRRHNETVTTSSSKSTKPLWHKIYYRINLVYTFLKRVNYIRKGK